MAGSNTDTEKKKVREKLLERREALDDISFEKHSASIIMHLREQVEFYESRVIHCYISMNERREVNTRPFIKELINHQEKKVVVPVANFDTGTMEHLYLEDFSQLEKNDWNLLEPKQGKEAAVVELDLVIVPMVGGDLNKNRIGYGKGFYDRFLQDVNCPKIGLLFERCLVEQLPSESHDVSLDKLITEERLIT